MAKIISMSLDEETLDLLDGIQEESDFSGRSEAIRTALRLFIQESESMESVVGRKNSIIITMHQRRDEHKLDKTKHSYENIIKTQIHNNLENDKCMELFILDGESEDIKSMYKELQEKDLEMVKLIFL